MIVECAWCRKKMGEIEPRESGAISHGICPGCLNKQRASIAESIPMKNHPKKGSAEAFEWARKMQRARAKAPKRNAPKTPAQKEATAKKIREVGKHREIQHFGAMRNNPIAVFGNPPKRVSAAIAGVIYNRLIEIRAEKTTHKPGFYRHPFAKNSRVQILALDNGDLLLHSTNGKRLWSEDGEI